MNNLFKFPFLGEALAPASSTGVMDMLVRTAVFLFLLGAGGYFFVFFHRRGYFGSGKDTDNKSCHDGIRVVSMRILSGRKYLVVVEHFNRRFLLAVANDKIESLSLWDMDGQDGHPRELPTVPPPFIPQK
jgi:hypothetical protein